MLLLKLHLFYDFYNYSLSPLIELCILCDIVSRFNKTVFEMWNTVHVCLKISMY